MSAEPLRRPQPRQPRAHHRHPPPAAAAATLHGARRRPAPPGPAPPPPPFRGAKGGRGLSFSAGGFRGFRERDRKAAGFADGGAGGGRFGTPGPPHRPPALPPPGAVAGQPGKVEEPTGCRVRSVPAAPGSGPAGELLPSRAYAPELPLAGRFRAVVGTNKALRPWVTQPVYPCWPWAQAGPRKIFFPRKEEQRVSELQRRLLKSPLSIYFGGIFPASGFPASSRVGPHGVRAAHRRRTPGVLWGGGPATRSPGYFWGCRLPGMEDGHSQRVGAEPRSRPWGPPAAQPHGRMMQARARLGPAEP